MNTLIQYIDNIDSMTENAEISVMESMIRSYDKSIIIIQEANDDTDLSAFDIFQEGEKWEKFKKDTEAPVFGNKGESLGKRLLMIIPRLIQKLVMLIQKLFKKNKSFESKMDKDIAGLKKNAEKVVAEPLTKEQSEKIAKQVVENAKAAETERKSHDNQKALDELEQMIHQMGEDLEETDKSLKNIGNMVQNIDKKNPGLIDEILETLGEPPRKKEKVSNMTAITNCKLFAMHNDELYVSFPVLNVDSLILTESSFDEIWKKNKHAQVMLANLQETISKMQQRYGDLVPNPKNPQSSNRLENTGNSFQIKYTDAFNVMNKMHSMYIKASEQIEDAEYKIEGKIINPANDALEKINKSLQDNTATDKEAAEKQADALAKYLTTLANYVSTIDKYLAVLQVTWNRTMINMEIAFGVTDEPRYVETVDVDK